MEIVFRFFTLLAAAVSAINWMVAERRMRAWGASEPLIVSGLARRVARVFYGSMIVFFLVLGALQWIGGYDDPLFHLYDRTRTPCSSAAWFLAALLWTIHIVGVWRPGVAEAALRLGLSRGPAVSGRTVRLIVTLGLLVNAVVFATLLAGAWGPIPRPKF